MSRSNSTTGITATQFNLRGKVALVTGASRGVGRGIAIVLADAGATVYITGRTVEEGAGRGGLPGSITSTAAEIAGRGGTAIAIACDHTVDAQTNAVFEQIDADQGGKVDILVNNVWGGYENLIVDGKSVENLPFWEQPTDRWNAMFDAGVHAHYVCSVEAAKRMVPARSGLIVTISFWAAQKFMSGVAYGSAKAADDKMCRDMGHQLRPHEVAVIALSGTGENRICHAVCRLHGPVELRVTGIHGSRRCRAGPGPERHEAVRAGTGRRQACPGVWVHRCGWNPTDPSHTEYRLNPVVWGARA